MKVFISWSGGVSRQIGEIIKDWLPSVLQNVKPYFTPNDIEKGSRWNTDISKELEQCRIGVFIYTKENLESQWMLFEAGAISKSLDNSKVCPILFGLDNSDFKGPLTQFQTSLFNKNDFKKLVKSINAELQEIKLEDKVFEEVFEMWWPKLEEKISKILAKEEVVDENLRSDRELLEEILALSRLNNRNLVRRINNVPYNIRLFEQLVTDFIAGTEIVFDWDWEHTKSCLDSSIRNAFISDEGSFLNPNVQNEDSDWGNRITFLESYRRLREFINDNNIKINPSFL